MKGINVGETKYEDLKQDHHYKFGDQNDMSLLSERAINATSAVIGPDETPQKKRGAIASIIDVVKEAFLHVVDDDPHDEFDITKLPYERLGISSLVGLMSMTGKEYQLNLCDLPVGSFCPEFRLVRHQGKTKFYIPDKFQMVVPESTFGISPGILCTHAKFYYDGFTQEEECYFNCTFTEPWIIEAGGLFDIPHLIPLDYQIRK